jgi:HD superfamily phosphodiesterase
MDILNTPGVAENIYQQALEVFFARKWGNRMLSSHDINHHRRVWNFARELMICTENERNNHSLDFYGKILIACYLHDLGMTVTTGVDHGFHSRNLAVEFLSGLNHDLSGWTDMLDAIEKHDNKEYSSGPEEKNKILVILSAADDMDAFGHTGIYRYLEIYIERGVPVEKIADEIRQNAANRFRNLESQFGKYTDLIEKHRKRYLILDDFFREFGSEAGFSK